MSHPQLDVLLLDPFYGGSHQEWGNTLQKWSCHRYRTLTLTGKYWKWRMRGGSMILADRYVQEDYDPDLILCSSMLDLPSFLARIAVGGKRLPPVLLYFHENQFLYPVPDGSAPAFKEQRNAFGSMNWRSALVADRLIFNSHFHRKGAFEAFREFVRRAPDHTDFDALQGMEERSTVYPPAPDLSGFTGPEKKDGDKPVLLWNHRWEAEKGPESFARIAGELMEERPSLHLSLLGAEGSAEGYRRELKGAFPERTLHSAPLPSREEYSKALARADITLVTSHQDFFGLSVVEAMYHGVVPVLPDRLAYPEHVPEEWNTVLLYEREEEAKKRCLELIDGKLAVPPDAMRSAVEAYDVREWIGGFDDELRETVRNCMR